MPTLLGVEALQQSSRDFGLCLEWRQLERGVLTACVDAAPADDCFLQYLSSDKAVEAVGAYLPGYYALHMPVGGVRLAQNGLVAAAGDWLLLTPNVESQANNALSTGGTYILHFPRQVLEQCFQDVGSETILGLGSALLIRPDAAAADAALRLSRAWLASIAEADAIELCDQIICLLVGALQGEQVMNGQQLYPRQQHRKAIVGRVRQYFEVNYHGPVRITDLCRQIGISQRTLSRSFRQELGISPQRYLEALRLNAARRLILDEDMCERSIGELAASCGLHHFGRFSVSFKHHFGVSPSQLARNSRHVGGLANFG